MASPEALAQPQVAVLEAEAVQQVTAEAVAENNLEERTGHPGGKIERDEVMAQIDAVFGEVAPASHEANIDGANSRALEQMAGEPKGTIKNPEVVYDLSWMTDPTKMSPSGKRILNPDLYPAAGELISNVKAFKELNMVDKAREAAAKLRNLVTGISEESMKGDVEAVTPTESMSFSAQTWEDLEKQIEANGNIQGSKLEYSSEDNLQLVAMVRQYPPMIRAITRTAGLRENVKTLLRNELAAKGNEIPSELEADSVEQPEAKVTEAQPEAGTESPKKTAETPEAKAETTPEEQAIAGQINTRNEIQAVLAEVAAREDDPAAKEMADKLMHSITERTLTSGHVEAIKDELFFEASQTEAGIQVSQNKITEIQTLLDTKKAELEGPVTSASAENLRSRMTPEQVRAENLKKMQLGEEIKALEAELVLQEQNINTLQSDVQRLRELASHVDELTTLQGVSPEDIAKVEALMKEDSVAAGPEAAVVGTAQEIKDKKAGVEKAGEEERKEVVAKEGEPQSFGEQLLAEAKKMENMSLDELKAERDKAEVYLEVFQISADVLRQTRDGLQEARARMEKDGVSTEAMDEQITALGEKIAFMEGLTKVAQEYVDTLTAEIARREAQLKEDGQTQVPESLQSLVDSYPGLMDLLVKKSEQKQPNSFLEWLILVFSTFSEQKNGGK